MDTPFVVVQPDGLVPLQAGMDIELLFRDDSWQRVRIETLIRIDNGLTLFWRKGPDGGSVILRNGLNIERQGVRL